MIQIVDKITHYRVFQKGSETLCASSAFPAHIEMFVEHTGNPLIFRSYLNNHLNVQLEFDFTDDGEIYCEVDRDVVPSMYIRIALSDMMNRFEDGRYYFGRQEDVISRLATHIFWLYRYYRIEYKQEDTDDRNHR